MLMREESCYDGRKRSERRPAAGGFCCAATSLLLLLPPPPHKSFPSSPTRKLLLRQQACAAQNSHPQNIIEDQREENKACRCGLSGRRPVRLRRPLRLVPVLCGRARRLRRLL